MPRPEPQPGLARAVRQLRTERGLSQEELADRAGVHLTWVGRMESGLANPSWGITKHLARALDVPHHTLAALGERLDGKLTEASDAGT
jgi:transcriptional regulator with XRE-family HTH domain